jgi:hypothetical protein
MHVLHGGCAVSAGFETRDTDALKATHSSFDPQVWDIIGLTGKLPIH